MKTGKSERAEPTWKTFQDLVGRIERVAAGKGATVSSPDRIRDKVTGRYRDVDVSIRQRVGSTEVLMMVECRRRKHKDDVTWIEQLVQRQESLGAALTIAVSSSGFSSQAIALAELKGIVLRHLAEISDSDIEALLTPVFHVRPQVRVAAVDFKLMGSPDLIKPTEYAESLLRALEEGADAPLLKSSEQGELSLNDVFMGTLRTQGTRPFDDVPEDGTAVLKDIQLTVPQGRLSIETIDGPKSVVVILLKVWFYRIDELVRPDVAVQYHRVRGGYGSVRHSEYEVGGVRPVRLTLQEDDETTESRVAVEIRDKKGKLRPATLEFIRSGHGPDRGSPD